MASKISQSTRDLARHVTRAVYQLSDGQPRKWRMLSSIPDATAASVLYAVDQGWIELEGRPQRVPDGAGQEDNRQGSSLAPGVLRRFSSLTMFTE
jgi:hypothetical protein